MQSLCSVFRVAGAPFITRMTVLVMCLLPASCLPVQILRFLLFQDSQCLNPLSVLVWQEARPDGTAEDCGRAATGAITYTLALQFGVFPTGISSQFTLFYSFVSSSFYPPSSSLPADLGRSLWFCDSVLGHTARTGYLAAESWASWCPPTH